MSKIRVLVVDDGVIIRRLVSDVLEEDPEIEVVGVASNGKIAMAKIPQISPQVVILDVEMPEMGGLETLDAIQKFYPDIKVIMFSSHTGTGAAITMDALFGGAKDYMAKPSHTGSLENTRQELRNNLIPKVKNLVSRKEGTFAPNLLTPTIPPPFLPSSSLPSRNKISEYNQGQIEVVAIGVSTGGPTALATLLSDFPADFPLPIVIVQHMSALFTTYLAERLDSKCALPVREGKGGTLLTPGEVYVAPGGVHMIVSPFQDGVQLRTHQGPKENSCRPSVDVLFRSVAQVYKNGTLAVILTGMGKDGMVGCEMILENNGKVLVQDKASSVVWGMPGAVAEAGMAHKVLPLEQIGQEIVRRVKRNYARRK